MTSLLAHIFPASQFFEGMGAVITFKPGDEVELKSGGPRMTVLQSYVHNGRGNNHDYAECQWYEKGEYKKNVFLKSSLRLIKSY